MSVHTGSEGAVQVAINHYRVEDTYDRVYLHVEYDSDVVSSGLSPETARAIAADLIEHAQRVEDEAPKEPTNWEKLEKLGRHAVVEFEGTQKFYVKNAWGSWRHDDGEYLLEGEANARTLVKVHFEGIGA